MKQSSNSMIQTKTTGHLPEIDPIRATIEETDMWIALIGGRELSREQMTRIVKETHWANVPGENPGGPEFPFSSYLEGGKESASPLYCSLRKSRVRKLPLKPTFDFSNLSTFPLSYLVTRNP